MGAATWLSTTGSEGDLYHYYMESASLHATKVVLKAFMEGYHQEHLIITDTICISTKEICHLKDLKMLQTPVSSMLT